jgi:hypothetical protein
MLEQDMAIRIIGLYRANPMNVMSIHEISTKLNKKYPFVHKKTKELVKKGILQMSPMGRSHLCSLNLANPFARYLLGFSELLYKDIQDTSKDASALMKITENMIHVLQKKYTVLFALFSKEEEIYIVVDEDTVIDHIKNNDGYNVNIVGKKEFVSFLIESDLYENHILLYGFESYAAYIQEYGQDLQRAYNPLLRNIL